MNRNPSRLQRDPRVLAAFAFALALSCAADDALANSRANVIDPAVLANTIQQWFWRGLGATVTAIVAGLFLRSVAIRKMRRTLVSPGAMSR